MTIQNLAAFSCVWLALLLPARLSAATRTVTSLADSGAGTLREAIILAASGDSIDFAVSGTIALTSGELGISRNLTIKGPGPANLSVNANHAGRVFHIFAGTVSISDVVITNGFVEGNPARGGGIYNDGNLTLSNCVLRGNQARGFEGRAGTNGCFSDIGLAEVGGPGGSSQGGGVYNGGSLVLASCSLWENESIGGAGGKGGNGLCISANCRGALGGQGGGASGGGIFSVGALRLENCTLVLNRARPGAGGSGGDGTGNNICPNNSVFIGGNGGNGGNGGDGSGGAIVSFTGFMSVNSTVASNAVVVGVGGYGGVGGLGRDYNGSSGANGANGRGVGGGLLATNTTGMINTILARNDAPDASPDVSGAITSQGHNLIDKSDGSSGWLASDLIGLIAAPLDPQLGPFQDNGGPTPTMALGASSAAIDTGDDAVLGAPYRVTTDQRGSARRTGAHVDIGAFEYGPPPPSPGRLRFSAAAYAVAEEADSILITVWRTLGTVGTVTVDYATADGTATAPSDYIAASGTLVFNAGETSKTFSVRIVNDGLFEGNEVFNLTLSSPSNTFLMSPSTAQVTILNDDRPTRLVTTFSDSGGGSLRNAIQIANSGDLILFAPVVRGKILLTGGELFINKPLTIIGPGASALAISGNNNSRVFNIGPQGNVTIQALTITEGLMLGANGGPQSGGSSAFGGGVYSEGTLALVDCMITINRAQGGRGGSGELGGTLIHGGTGGEARGGGIYNLGSLTLTRSTLLGNIAQGGGGGDGGFNAAMTVAGNSGAGGGAGGGAIRSPTGAHRLENCTVSENWAVGGRGGFPAAFQASEGAAGSGGTAFGGALFGAYVLESCTIARNAAMGGANAFGIGAAGTVGGVTGGFPRSTTAHNCIIAENLHTTSIPGAGPDAANPDSSTAWTSQGWNLVGITDGSSGWTTNDILGNSTFPTNALLGPCQNNGGPVWTMCPLAGSPARDHGRSDLATDARGGRRILDFPTIANAPGGNGTADGWAGAAGRGRAGAMRRAAGGAGQLVAGGGQCLGSGRP